MEASAVLQLLKNMQSISTHSSDSTVPKFSQQCNCNVDWSRVVTVMTIGSRKVEMRSDLNRVTCIEIDAVVPAGQERNYLVDGVHYRLVGPLKFTKMNDKFLDKVDGKTLPSCQGTPVEASAQTQGQAEAKQGIKSIAVSAKDLVRPARTAGGLDKTIQVSAEKLRKHVLKNSTNKVSDARRENKSA
jgi:hypothetical protein